MEKIIIGLLCVMTANILFGVTLSKFKQEFSFKVLVRGIYKALCIVVGCILMYLCGVLNPDIMVCKIGGVSMTLNEAIETLFVAGIVMYAYKDLIKIKELLNLTVTVEEYNNKSKTIEIPIENNIKGENNEV